MNSCDVVQRIIAKAIINHAEVDTANLLIEGLLTASKKAESFGEDLYQMARSAAKIRLATLVDNAQPDQHA